MKSSAIEKNLMLEKAAAEIKELVSIMNDGITGHINAKNYKFCVVQRLIKRKRKDKIKRETIIKKPESELSLIDLNHKIELMSSKICSLEKRIDSANKKFKIYK